MTTQLHSRCVDDYTLPDDVHIEAVKSGEVRVLQRGGQTYTAVIVDRATQTYKLVLPLALFHVPLLVLVMAQGSIGTASNGFVKRAKKMWFCNQRI